MSDQEKLEQTCAKCGNHAHLGSYCLLSDGAFSRRTQFTPAAPASDQEKLPITGGRLAEIELAVGKGQFTNGFEREFLAEVKRLRGIPAESPAAPDADQAAYAKECVPEDGRMTTMRGAATPVSDQEKQPCPNCGDSGKVPIGNSFGFSEIACPDCAAAVDSFNAGYHVDGLPPVTPPSAQEKPPSCTCDRDFGRAHSSDCQIAAWETLGLLIKLGSLVVHADELLSPDGRQADRIAIEGLLSDPEVIAWIKGMGAMLPLKRKA